ncbi:MAG: DNA gyrase subunit A, partial [Oscillospiraceae bacterium]|nr:DNA gyrase subunit A [Oscillospiraceae bacterium]
DGMSICFDENDVRPTGRTAGGIRGIKLREGDYCIGAGVSGEGEALLTVTENGYGKRTLLEEYMRGTGDELTTQGRGGFGVKNYRVTDKTGGCVDARVVSSSDDVLMIADDGTMIRMAVDDISLYGRQTQGVRVMRLGEGSRVIAVSCTEKSDEPEEADDREEDSPEPVSE